MYFEYMPIEFFLICAALFGAAAGSFFLVCICRIPAEESIVTPGSHCPECRNPIRWHDNIPILSYLILKGKCRYCQAQIPLRYPIYEFLTALLFMGIVYEYRVGNTAFLYIFFISILLISSGIDWDHFYIPDRFSLPMIPFSIVAAAAAQWLHLFPEALVQTVPDALWGIVVGTSIIWSIRIVGTWYFQQEAMGFGDVKLIAYIGGFLGWDNVLVCIFLAFLIGSVVGITLKIIGKIGKYGHLPFGPYLALGAYLTLLFGPELIAWYTKPFYATPF